MTDEDSHLRAGRRHLLLLAGIFAAPIGLAILLNSRLVDYHPAAEKNRGTLVQPPLRVKTADHIVSSRGILDLGQQARQWWLVAVEAAHCPRTCRQRLDELRRVRHAMGRRIGQVPVLVLTTGDGRGFTLPGDNDLHLANAHQNVGLVRALRGAGDSGTLIPGQRYIINLGWIMMTYPPDQPNTDVLKDLQLLSRTRQ